MESGDEWHGFWALSVNHVVDMGGADVTIAEGFLGILNLATFAGIDHMRIMADVWDEDIDLSPTGLTIERGWAMVGLGFPTWAPILEHMPPNYLNAA